MALTAIPTSTNSISQANALIGLAPLLPADLPATARRKPGPQTSPSPADEPATQ